ncbi:MAG: amylo-alpha-1,6-glucosidase [Chloroflexota bacterium]
MDSLTHWDIKLAKHELRGRTFLLGNKRAFSLSLPAVSGPSPSTLHPHKWYGAYSYGRKFLEGQVIRVAGQRRILSARQQTALSVGLTTARRDYELDGSEYHEEYFVPDGLQAFACDLRGDAGLVIEPEFDIRLCRALNYSTEDYTVTPIDGGVVVSNALPSGTYDDLTEVFLSDESGSETTTLFAAVQVTGDDCWTELVPASARSRHKLFRKDAQRARFLGHSDADAADHAPLWRAASSQVLAPVRLHLPHGGTVIYGFGSSCEEALNQLETLRDNLLAFQVQKMEAATEIVSHARLETGSEAVDRAYVQVLTRMMDALVARNAVAEDTALDGPATMILAGNQYFHDSWKRDENIALGFLLSLGFYDLARNVINDTWRLQDQATGRLPQRIRAGEAPPYHSSDGTLWALWRLYQYWRCTGDWAMLHDKLGMVELFFRKSLARTVNGLLPSGRTSAPEYLWETWMDTPHTPRDGFPVEIQMLWIACLRVYRPLFKEPVCDLESLMETAESEAWMALQQFNVRGMPADSLDEQGEARDLITPNPYFCFGVGLDLGTDVERSMRVMGRRQLAGRQGIITLAPLDWNRVFSAEFLSDRRNVRGRRMRSTGKFNYHRGVEWNWLAQFFVRAELKYGEPNVALVKYLQRQINAALHSAGIGGISELFDLSGTRGPEFQAWSMSGFLEALQAFAGVQIDVPERHIAIAPQLPDVWPKLAVRKWYGSIPFDMTFEALHTSRSLIIEFPWGEAPEAEMEIAIVLPRRTSTESIATRLNGIPQAPDWTLKQMSGTHRACLRMTVPAANRIEIDLELGRASGRMGRRTA